MAKFLDKFLPKLLSILLIVFITLLILNQFYVVVFSDNLKLTFIFLSFAIMLIISSKELFTGSSNLFKFLGFITLSATIAGGISSILNQQLSILIYISIFLSILYSFFDLIQAKV